MKNTDKEIIFIHCAWYLLTAVICIGIYIKDSKILELQSTIKERDRSIEVVTAEKSNVDSLYQIQSQINLRIQNLGVISLYDQRKLEADSSYMYLITKLN